MSEVESERSGVRELGLARGVLDFGLLRESVTDSRPEILVGCGGYDGGVDEDVRGRSHVHVALERVVVVVDDGDGGGARAVGADGRHGEHDLGQLLGRRLHGVYCLSAADCERDVCGAEGLVVHERIDGRLRRVGAVDDFVEYLDLCFLKRGSNTRCGGGKRAFSSYQSNAFGPMRCQAGGNRIEAILADGVAAHLNGSHDAS